MFSLYEVMQIKTPVVNARLKEEMEEEMRERNKYIKEGMKKWEKQYLLFKYVPRKG